MASNSLRGGKNIYGATVLQSNWFEERLEPGNAETANEKTHQQPVPTAKTWSKTSEEYGNHMKEEMQKASMATETSNWLKYQKDGPDRYDTTTGSTHCQPDQQVPPTRAPEAKDEEALKQYQETWTKSTNPDQFKQFNTIGK
mmetsp:Transcript_88036/g.233735  ORF Transcript_88036/g.233735 Transcript_88036/m.233735 type:complete len:142 (-) Transcript_88036:78-503(-)